MSTMNPLKFLGGLVLEVGAVIAALAILPGLGGSGLNFTGLGSANNDRLVMPTAAGIIPNQVYFDAKSSRMVDEPRQAPPAAWQNDFAPPPPATQQRYVENMLDHNSQRALDAAARIWTQGDRLLPPELRVRREPQLPTQPQFQSQSQQQNYTGEPIRDWQQPRTEFRAEREAYSQPQPTNSQPQSAYSQQQPAADRVLTSEPPRYVQESHYAPASRPAQRFNGQY